MISNTLLFLQKVTARPTDLRDNIVFLDVIVLTHGPPVTSNSNESSSKLLPGPANPPGPKRPFRMHSIAFPKISNVQK